MEAPAAVIGLGEVGLSRLARKAKAGFEAVRPFAEIATMLKGEHLGSYHGKMDSFERPFNQIHEFVRATLPNLTARNPVVEVTATAPAGHFFAELHKQQMNALLRRLDFWWTSRLCCTDAVFLMGIGYCGLADSGWVTSIDGKEHALGDPFFDWIALDDFGVDPVARNPEEATFFQRRGLYNLADIEAKGLVPGNAIDTLRALPRYSDETGDEARDLSKPQTRMDEDEDGEWVYLTEIFMPKDRRVVRMAGHRDPRVTPPAIILSDDEEWYGPDVPTGPYEFLGFSWLGDVFFPASPASLGYDMHKLENRVGKKIARQIMAMKNIVTGPAEAEDDLNEIRNAEDNAVLTLGHPGQVGTVQVGGPQELSLALVQWLQGHGSKIFGNADMLGGVQSSDRKTATEAKILSGNQNVRLSDMVTLKDRFETRIVRRLSWYEFYNPMLNFPAVRSIPAPGLPGGRLELSIMLTPEMRAGDWLDYNIRTEINSSAAPPDPEVRSSRVMAWAGNIVPLAINLAMMTQGAFKAGPFIRDMGKMVDPDLDPGRYFDDGDIEAAITRQMQSGLYSPPPATMNMGGAANAPGGMGGGMGRKPGIPGSDGMPGGMMTGSNSPNFDAAANTGATLAAV